MKIRKINWFLKLFAAGITLAPFGIYVMEYHMKNKRIINHEKIHWKQQMEMLITGLLISIIVGGILFNSLTLLSIILLVLFPFLFFYIVYVVEWIIRLFTNNKNAYRSISFEREARDNQLNQNYLKTRKPYSWIKYIIKK